MPLSAEKSTIVRIFDPWFSPEILDLRIRPLRAGELQTIDDVFAGLSLESRHQRFHTGVVRLSDRARQALANVDGTRHIALVAEVRTGRRWLPVGLVRLHETEPRHAEVAIEVADLFHGCGVGRHLLTELRAIALNAGYQQLTATILPGNRAAVALLRAVFPDAMSRYDDHEIEYALPLTAHRVAAA